MVNQEIDLFIKALPDKREQIMTFKEQLQQEGIQQGMLLGRQEGLHQAQLDMAKKLLAKGIDRTIVKEIIGLSDDELDTL